MTIKYIDDSVPTGARRVVAFMVASGSRNPDQITQREEICIVSKEMLGWPMILSRVRDATSTNGTSMTRFYRTST